MKENFKEFQNLEIRAKLQEIKWMRLEAIILFDLIQYL